MSVRTRNKVSVAFSMSSMTDIVFLLLIFFIILSTLVNPFGVKVDLPNGNTQAPPQAEISVSITKGLQYSLDGKDVSKDQLEALLNQRKGEVSKPNIILRVDKSVPTGETVEFMALAKEYGFNIVIATKPK